MTNNSDGLTPTLRPQLGVGWNRALPAPFGFDNGIKGDGSNDYMRSKSVNVPLNKGFTIQFWIKLTDTTTREVFAIVTDRNTYYITMNNNQLRFDKSAGTGSDGARNNIFAKTFDVGIKALLTITVPTTTIYPLLYKNNDNSALVPSQQLSGTFIEPGENLQYYAIFSTGRGSSGNQHIDELRIYNRILSKDEVAICYNSGIGLAPPDTESLIAYYQFQEFENLDFSALGDETDIRLGIRDLSGQRMHLEPFNMDTNPASGTYVLQPF